jgi:CheY-like chemotaxis protein
MLRNGGFTVEEVKDGFEALNRISEKQFDIIFLDISMPGIDGIETLNRIRKLEVDWRNLPAIAVTAHAAPKDHDSIRKAPFSEILVKPVRPQDIQAKLPSNLKNLHTVSNAKYRDHRGGDFKVQFGEEKYQEALKSFKSEVNDFHKLLTAIPEFTEELRQRAHKLSGSAAVLGEKSMHLQLQLMEHYNKATWSEQKETLAQSLREFSSTSK